jgi:cytochrome c1
VRWDAVLLDCHDDYQVIISIYYILKYDLRLALEMKLAVSEQRPSWLNPMMVIVPDSKEAPHQERFMTANIRELRFVRLSEYYAPLDKVALKSMHAHRGGQVFKDNCLFCHSLKGIGGNKGTDLLRAYDFSKGADGPQFKKDFAAFHYKDNADKQDMEQFVDTDTLRRIVVFLREVQGSS